MPSLSRIISATIVPWQVPVAAATAVPIIGIHSSPVHPLAQQMNMKAESIAKTVRIVLDIFVSSFNKKVKVYRIGIYQPNQNGIKNWYYTAN
jgi:hypothetical protein